MYNVNLFPIAEQKKNDRNKYAHKESRNSITHAMHPS